MSNSVRPHRRQPTRLHRPWDSPGKNTGVGCHFLLQCVKVKSESESEVAQSCPTLRDSMDCSLPGSSVHGIFQASVLEWVAIATPKPYSFLPSQPAFRELNSGESQTLYGASLVAQLVKNLPPVRETWVQSLGWDDPLEKELLPTPVFWSQSQTRPGDFHFKHSMYGRID